MKVYIYIYQIYLYEGLCMPLSQDRRHLLRYCMKRKPCDVQLLLNSFMFFGLALQKLCWFSFSQVYSDCFFLCSGLFYSGESHCTTSLHWIYWSEGFLQLVYWYPKCTDSSLSLWGNTQIPAFFPPKHLHQESGRKCTKDLKTFSDETHIRTVTSINCLCGAIRQYHIKIEQILHGLIP